MEIKQTIILTEQEQTFLTKPYAAGFIDILPQLSGKKRKLLMKIAKMFARHK